MQEYSPIPQSPIPQPTPPPTPAPIATEPELAPPLPFEQRRQEVLRVAAGLSGQAPDWVTFFREILGTDGVARRLFPTPEQWAQFEQSAEHEEIQKTLAKLRERNRSNIEDEDEPTRVITVRLPKSLHESLRAEAHNRHTSMNKLCISKLLQVIDDQLIPTT